MSKKKTMLHRKKSFVKFNKDFSHFEYIILSLGDDQVFIQNAQTANLAKKCLNKE